MPRAKKAASATTTADCCHDEECADAPSACEEAVLFSKVSEDNLKDYLRQAIKNYDLNEVSMKQVRVDVETHFALEPNSLRAKDEKPLLRHVVEEVLNEIEEMEECTATAVDDEETTKKKTKAARGRASKGASSSGNAGAADDAALPKKRKQKRKEAAEDPCEETDDVPDVVDADKKTKKNKKKKIDDSDGAPKKRAGGPNAYIIFCSDRAKDVSGLEFRERAQHLSALWKNTSDEEKAAYKLRSVAIKETGVDPGAPAAAGEASAAPMEEE